MTYLKISAVFLDLFMLLVFFLYIQWYLAIIQMNPAQEDKPTSKPRAEIIIANVWQEIEEDVDIWIRRKGHEIVGYKNREAGPFKLHGDHTSENYGVVDGNKLLEALEVITVTKKIPGIYQISLHGYDLSAPVDVTIEVELVEPYSLLCKLNREVYHGKETPVCEFTINSDGEIENVIINPNLLSNFLHLAEIK